MTEYMKGLLEGYNRCIGFVDEFDPESNDLQMQILKKRLALFIESCCPTEKKIDNKNNNK